VSEITTLGAALDNPFAVFSQMAQDASLPRHIRAKADQLSAGSAELQRDLVIFG
jgi:uncharacterized protein (UPF0147 family)